MGVKNSLVSKDPSLAPGKGGGGVRAGIFLVVARSGGTVCLWGSHFLQALCRSGGRPLHLNSLPTSAWQSSPSPHHFKLAHLMTVMDAIQSCCRLCGSCSHVVYDSEQQSFVGIRIMTTLAKTLHLQHERHFCQVAVCTHAKLQMVPAGTVQRIVQCTCLTQSDPQEPHIKHLQAHDKPLSCSRG